MIKLVYKLVVNYSLQNGISIIKTTTLSKITGFFSGSII